MLEMGSRIVARVIASRIRDWAEAMKLIDVNQNGFRQGRLTADAAQCFVRIQEEIKHQRRTNERANTGEEDNEEATAVLLDITKAYPRVNKPLLWEILRKSGMGGKCLRFLQNLHEQTQYKVRIRNEESTEWTPQRGLREGCATSPACFNIYHAAVMKIAVNERKRIAELNGRQAGLSWTWKPGNQMPPISRTKATTSSEVENFVFSESFLSMIPQ